jgi:hypothetical protein
MLRSMWTVTRLRARSAIGGDVSEPDGGEHGDGEIHGTDLVSHSERAAQCRPRRDRHRRRHRLLERASHTSANRGDVHGAITAMIRAADLSPQPDERRRRMASAAYLSASLLGDLSDVPHLLDAPTPAAGAPLVAAPYHAFRDGQHRHGAQVPPHRTGDVAGEFSPAVETLLEAFYTWVRVCYFGNRARW